jgi:serine/threonine-protein kinase
MHQLGKYEIIEVIGNGATAEVYRARDTVLDREVALKVLHPALVIDVTAFERFLQEARAAAGLFHPNIATVLDTGEAEGRFYIAMRYVDGRSLDKILADEGPLTSAEVLKLADQIGGALQFAHQKGYLHRDVKPANIVRSSDGDYVLTDFGLVRAMMITGITTHTGAVLGTPAYIPPEVWRNQPASPAMDQYALACVLYEALTGKVLFIGDTPPAIMTAHVLDGPGSLADIPIQWRGPLQRALGKDPRDRYADMRAFLADLSIPNPSVAPPVNVPPPPMVPVRPQINQLPDTQPDPQEILQKKPEAGSSQPNAGQSRGKIFWIAGGALASVTILCILVIVLTQWGSGLLGQSGSDSPMISWTTIPTDEILLENSAPTAALPLVTNTPVGYPSPTLPTMPTNTPIVRMTAASATPRPITTSASGPIPLIVCKLETKGLCISSFGDVNGTLMITLRNDTDFTNQYSLTVNGSSYYCRSYQVSLKFLYCTGVMQVPNKSLYAEFYELNPEELVAAGNIVIPPISPSTATPRPTDKPDPETYP